MSTPQYSRDPSAEKFVSSMRASFTPADQYSMHVDIDNPPLRPNDRRMTDINRQQVSDMLTASEAKVEARLANFDTSVKTGFADLRAEFAALRTEMANGRTDAAKQSNESLRWIIGSVFTFVSISVAIIAALINFNKGDKPQTYEPTAASAAGAPAIPPVVIYTQPAPTQAPAKEQATDPAKQ